MITDRFGALLAELSAATKLKFPTDVKMGCKVRYPDKLNVTIELDHTGEFVILLAEIGPPGEGHFKESVMREALRANGQPSVRGGVFCYTPKSNKILLYDRIPMEDLNGQRLAELLQVMTERARQWRDSIARGEVPTGSTTAIREGFMGLR